MTASEYGTRRVDVVCGPLLLLLCAPCVEVVWCLLLVLCVGVGGRCPFTIMVALPCCFMITHDDDDDDAKL